MSKWLRSAKSRNSIWYLSLHSHRCIYIQLSAEAKRVLLDGLTRSCRQHRYKLCR